MARAIKEGEKAVETELDEGQKELPSSNKSELLRSATAPVTSPTNSGNISSSSVSNAKSAATETMQALKERGDRLQNVAQSSEAMAEVKILAND